MTFKLSKEQSDRMDKIRAKLQAAAEPEPLVVRKGDEKIEIPAAIVENIPEGCDLDESTYNVPELMQSDMGREAISDAFDYFFDRVSAKTEEAAQEMGFTTKNKKGMEEATIENLDKLLRIKHDLQLTTLLGLAFVFSSERMGHQDGDLLDFNIKQFLGAIGLCMKVGATANNVFSDIEELAREADVDLYGIIKKLKDKYGADPNEMTDETRERVIADLKQALKEAAE